MWYRGENDVNVLFLSSDAAWYMIKVSKTLNIFFINLVHITYHAHIIQSVAEKVYNSCTQYKYFCY